MKQTKEDIFALIQKGETFHLECKKAQGGLPSSLWESYSAFCNTDGGVILLGVKEFEDKHFEVVGVSDAQKLVQDFTNTLNDRNKVSANVLTDKNVQIVDCDGKAVVAIEVPRADRADKSVYLNKDMFDQTYLNMSTVDLSEDSATANIGAESDQNPTNHYPNRYPRSRKYTEKYTENCGHYTEKYTENDRQYTEGDC